MLAHNTGPWPIDALSARLARIIADTLDGEPPATTAAALRGLKRAIRFIHAQPFNDDEPGHLNADGRAVYERGHSHASQRQHRRFIIAAGLFAGTAGIASRLTSPATRQHKLHRRGQKGRSRALQAALKLAFSLYYD